MAVDVDFVSVHGAAASVSDRAARNESVVRRRRGAGSNNGVALAVGQRLAAADEGRPFERYTHRLRTLRNPRGVARGGFDRRAASHTAVFSYPANDPADVTDVG